MSQMMSTIGQGLSKFGSSKALPGILTGFGAVSNFLQGRKQNKYVDQQLRLQKEMEGLMNNPAELASREAQFEKPLSAGLTQGVGNEVQAFLAERGLSQSPSIAAEVESQALAPYKQQNQQLAVAELFRSLGLPFQGQPPQFAPPADLSGLLKLLMTPKGGVKAPMPGAPEESPDLTLDNLMKIMGPHNELPEGDTEGFDFGSFNLPGFDMANADA